MVIQEGSPEAAAVIAEVKALVAGRKGRKVDASSIAKVAGCPVCGADITRPGNFYRSEGTCGALSCLSVDRARQAYYQRA